MIQRKQTLFLFLSFVVICICLFFPVLGIEPQGMGVEDQVFNLGVRGSNGVLSFGGKVLPLFVLLAVVAVLSLVDIFLYHNRQLQAKLCTWGIVFCLAWYVFLTLIFTNVIVMGEGTMHLRFASCLPLVAMVFLFLARRGILADEELIRSADRIR